MAHELTESDVLMLRGDAAWHGLGTIVDENLGAIEGAERVGLLWEVEQVTPKITLESGIELPMSGYRANVRADTQEVLGVVSSDWKIVQNRQLAEFCDELVEGGDKLTIETCGSIRGGRKLWFLIRGDSFSVRGKDSVEQYICVSNGFDGKTGIRVTPTNVRVVCSNTLHAVIPQYDGMRFSAGRENSFACSHVGDLNGRIRDVKAAIGLYRESSAASADVATELDRRQVTLAEMTEFYLQMYTKQFADVLSSDCDPRDKQKSMAGFHKYSKRFEREANQFGPTRWIMANAYSGWLQHDKVKHEGFGMDERKVAKNLFGVGISQADEAFAFALAT